jgi:hypothetical protein
MEAISNLTLEHSSTEVEETVEVRKYSKVDAAKRIKVH